MRIIFLLFCLGLPIQGFAGFIIGNELMRMCDAHLNNTDISQGNGCAGYVMGVVDVHDTFFGYWGQMEKQWCAPETLNSEELVQVVTKYLHEHPEVHYLPAGNAVASSLKETFPCK